MQPAQRMKNLAPYLFAQLEAQIDEAREAGADVINLGIGDPDQPTPNFIVEELSAQAGKPENHQYPSSRGTSALRQAVAAWYKRRSGIDLNPNDEVAALIGSKEGIAHLAFCFLDPGDIALVPDPGYPVYQGGTALAGGTAYFMPLLRENGFLPVFADIPSDVARRAKLMFFNYPNNPTGAVADAGFFQEAVDFARSFDILAVHDGAYLEIGFGADRQRSFLETPGSREIGLEFGSLSKSHNMTGWRIGWAAGRAAAIEQLVTFKSNVDSGVFAAVQHSAVRALREPQDHLGPLLALYQKRRDMVVAALRRMGWEIEAPQGSIYIWAPTPPGIDSRRFAGDVFEKTAVVLTPGNGYGQGGEGYFRISLTVATDRLQEAMARLEAAGVSY